MYLILQHAGLLKAEVFNASRYAAVATILLVFTVELICRTEADSGTARWVNVGLCSASCIVSQVHCELPVNLGDVALVVRVSLMRDTRRFFSIA